MIKEISKKMLRRYAKVRRKIDQEAMLIESLSSLLNQYRYCGDDTLRIDPVALGHVHGLINRSILNIREYLDDYIYLAAAQLRLGELEDNRDLM